MAEDSPELVMAAVQKVIASLDVDRREGVESCAKVLRSVVRTSNKRAGAVGDLALLLVSAERSKGPID